MHVRNSRDKLQEERAGFVLSERAIAANMVEKLSLCAELHVKDVSPSPGLVAEELADVWVAQLLK